MSPRIRYSRDKVKSSSSNSSLKLILIISFIAIIVVIIVGLKYFFSPYVADSTGGEITALDEEGIQETNTGLLHSGKDMQQEVDFTFFDTLSKPGKYSSLNQHEEDRVSVPLKGKKRTSSKPESSQSIEKKEQETQQSPGDSKYFIQMGSFKEKSRAETFIAMLNKKGYQTSIESAEISNRGLWYRVFLEEGFLDREPALRWIEKIKHKDNISAFLKTSNNRK